MCASAYIICIVYTEAAKMVYTDAAKMLNTDAAKRQWGRAAMARPPLGP